MLATNGRKLTASSRVARKIQRTLSLQACGFIARKHNQHNGASCPTFLAARAPGEPFFLEEDGIVWRKEEKRTLEGAS